MDILHVSGMEKSFGNKKIISVNDFTIGSAKGYLINGYNGCGKTTFLRLLAGLERADCGTLDLSMDIKDRVMCFQQPYIFTGDVKRNLLYGARLKKIIVDTKILSDYIERYGLQGVMEQKARTLSSGEKQCVAIIRALITQPGLLILDEPTANLDKQKIEALNQDLIQLKKRGSSFIVSANSNQRLFCNIDHCYLLENSVLSLETINRKVNIFESDKQNIARSELLQSLWERIKGSFPDNCINCSDIFNLCKEHSIEKSTLSQIIGLKNIKVRKCQWGCFK